MSEKKSFVIPFDTKTGRAPESVRKPLERRVSNLSGIFFDNQALETAVSQGNPIVYEFYDMGMPETEGDIAFGTSIVHPGKVGEEFFMTKGHFHTILDTAEVYYCISGHGLMLMESPEGDVEHQEMEPGQAVYVPGRYAHRSINISLKEPLVMFFAFRADAGHDYGTIEEKGFRKLVVDRGGSYEIIDNPNWKES